VTLELGLIALVSVSLLGSILGNVVQGRIIGRQRAENDILKLGLAESQEHQERMAGAPPLGPDEQSARL
jgi:hypothetical protein